MKRISIDIFVKGKFYGTLRMPWLPCMIIDEAQLTGEIEKRLPLLRRQKYEIKF